MFYSFIGLQLDDHSIGVQQAVCEDRNRERIKPGDPVLIAATKTQEQLTDWTKGSELQHWQLVPSINESKLTEFGLGIPTEHTVSSERYNAYD